MSTNDKETKNFRLVLDEYIKKLKLESDKDVYKSYLYGSWDVVEEDLPDVDK